MMTVLLILLMFGVGLAEDGYLRLKDFTGGQNTTSHPTQLLDNEAILIQNMMFKNDVLIGRPAFSQYNVSDSFLGTGTSGIKGIHISSNKNRYIAWNGYLWKAKTPSATNSQFQRVDSLADTLASANYVNFLDYNDTTYFVDGRNLWKTAGDSLIRGNIVWQGKVSRLIGPPVATEDTVYLRQDREIDINVVNEGAPTRRYKDIDESYIGVNFGDTLRAFLRVDLSGFEVGDIITSATCSLVVNRERSTTDETLGIKRCSTILYDNVSWNTQPLVTGSNIGTAIITAPGTFAIDLTVWVDSVVNFGLVNRGLRLHLLDEINNNNAKSVILGGVGLPHANKIKIVILAIRKTSIVEAHPNMMLDTTVGGLWPTNRWQDFYVEFAGDSVSANGDYVRLIDSTKYDTLFLNVPLISPNWVATRNETYRIIAYPTSIDEIFTGKVESVTTISAVDSTRKIWVGTQSIVPSTYNNNRYFFKITSGRGGGIYQILYGNTTSSQDWFAVFSPRGDIVDSTTRFSIFQATFPKTKVITVMGNRAVFAGDSLHPNWIWYSEPKVLGEVGGLNFIPIGGEPSEGEITAIRTLFASGYSDPRNTLLMFKPQSISAIFSSNFETEVPIRVIDKFGTYSNRSVVGVEGKVYWQSTDGNFYVTDGQNIRLISAKIKGNIDVLYLASLSKTSVAYHNRSLIWTVYTSATAKKSLVYNVDNGAWSEFTFGFGPTAQINVATDALRPNTFMATHTDSGKVYIFGDPDFLTDGGTAITPLVRTKWYDMGNPNMLKRLTHVRGILSDESGVDTTVLFCSRDSSGVLKSTLIDTISLSLTGIVAGDINVLRYWKKRPLSKYFRFEIQPAFTSSYKMGEILIYKQDFKEVGY